MCFCDCKNNNDCRLTAIIASVIIGVIAAFLNFSATIVVPQFVLWILFGIAAGFLALTFLIAPMINRCETKHCICSVLSTLLLGIFGTILFALVLVLVDIAAAGLVGSLLAGLLFASFALTLTSVACFIKCLLNCN